eukprot:COSAG02_NODE_19218_length_894_cov_1.150943_2_plen_57_part_01
MLQSSLARAALGARELDLSSSVGALASAGAFEDHRCGHHEMRAASTHASLHVKTPMT